MKLLLIISALLASLTGLGPAERAQAFAVEQVAVSVRAAKATAAAHRPANEPAFAETVALELAFVPVLLAQFGERRRL